jgi:hypothetical protein
LRGLIKGDECTYTHEETAREIDQIQSTENANVALTAHFESLQPVKQENSLKQNQKALMNTITLDCSRLTVELDRRLLAFAYSSFWNRDFSTVVVR